MHSIGRLFGLCFGLSACSEYNIETKGGPEEGLRPVDPLPSEGGPGAESGGETEDGAAGDTATQLLDGGGTDGGGSSTGGGTDGGSTGGGTDGGTTGDGGGTDGGTTGDGGGTGGGGDTGGTGGGGSGGSIDTGGTGGSTGGTPPDPSDPDAFCAEASRTAGFLDAYQVAGDGKVLFCHDTGSHWNLVDTGVSACIPHLSGHSTDAFPTTGCDS